MSFLHEILNEDYDVPGEAEAMRRGNSDAWYRRHQSNKPRMMPSKTAGQWEYVPVNLNTGEFTKWNPPAKRWDTSPGGETHISVRQEGIDPVSEVTERIHDIVDAIFPEQGE